MSCRISLTISNVKGSQQPRDKGGYNSCNLTCIMQLRLGSTTVYNHWLVLFLSHSNAQGGHCAFLNKSLETGSCQKPDKKSSCELLVSIVSEQQEQEGVIQKSQVIHRYLHLEVSLPVNVFFRSFICIFYFHRSITQCLKMKKQKLKSEMQLGNYFHCYIVATSNKYLTVL